MIIRNVIFDFDGTLADTSANILATMKRTIAELGLPERTEAECRAMIGYRLKDVPARLWPEIDDDGISNRYVVTYRRIFNELKSHFRVNLYPDVSATLQRLQELGIKMAIASSRSHASLVELCQELGIATYFAVVVGGDDVREGKPSPEPVNIILLSQGWNCSETLVVGDMDVDMQMGSNARCRTCGVTYGNGTEQDLFLGGADSIITSFTELLKIRDKWQEIRDKR